jgi:DNA-binding CsgD family transcriptional regulator
MNTKEIADILGISPESVRMARYRLRKKMDLNTDDNLMDLILKY